MRSTTLSTLTLAAALVLGACSEDSVTAPSTAVSPDFARGGGGKGKGAKPSNRIVYTHKSAAGSQIYTMNPDGTNVVQVTTVAPGYAAFSPRWTPNQTRIVFVSTVLGAENVFSINADGTFAEQLTFGGCADRNPAPSPDGTKIAFQRACAGGGIFVMNIDGSNPTQLTLNSGDTHPSWTPDGKIVFANNIDLVHRIWRMNVDGSNKVALFSCGSFDICTAPMLSPDGTRLALWSNKNGGEIIVYTLATGAYIELANLGPALVSQYAPAWSPDGSKIVFTAGFFGSDVELYSADPTTGYLLAKLTSVVGADVAPSWHR